jgi:hypothetical protein
MAALSLLAGTFKNPRVAIIMSRTSFHQQWDVTQMSGHGWVGITQIWRASLIGNLSVRLERRRL